MATEIATAARAETPVLGRRGWDLEAPWRWYGVGSSGRAVIRGEEIDRFEVWLGAQPEAHYTGHLRVGDGLAPLPVGSQLDAVTGVVHVGAGRRVRRDVRPGVRALGRGAGGGAARGARDPRAEGPRARRRAGGDRHAALAAGCRAAVRAGRVGGGSGRGDQAPASTRCTCGRIRWRAARRCSWARRRSAARVRMSRPSMGTSSAPRGFTLAVQGLTPGIYDLAVFPWSNVTGAFAPPKIVHVTVR